MSTSRIPSVKCRQEDCGAYFVYVENPESGNRVPVDIDTFSDEEIEIMEATGTTTDIQYEKGRHISHFLTCTNPNRFSSGKKGPK